MAILKKRLRVSMWGGICLFCLCACGQPAQVENPSSTLEQRAQHHQAVVLEASAGDAERSDDDLDRISNECDQCPDDPETWNGILDTDGCPDSSGTSHSVIADPTNRFGHAIYIIDFDSGSATLPADAVERARYSVRAHLVGEGLRGVESAVCVGQAGPDEANPDGLSAARARSTCGLARQHLLEPGVTLVEHSVGAGEITDEMDPTRPPRPGGALIVIRADDVDVWRLDNTLFTRATPARRLEYVPALDPECLID